MVQSKMQRDVDPLIRPFLHQVRAVARPVAYPLRICKPSQAQLASCIFFSGIFFLSSADSSGASCQLLMKDWTLNTGKLPPETVVI